MGGRKVRLGFLHQPKVSPGANGKGGLTDEPLPSCAKPRGDPAKNQERCRAVGRVLRGHMIRTGILRELQLMVSAIGWRRFHQSSPALLRSC